MKTLVMMKFSGIDLETCKKIGVVATDIDGTITYHGQITERTIRTLTMLHDSGLQTILITGRSAGCGLSLMTFLPGLTGVIAENGGVVINEERVVWANGRSSRLSQAFRSLLKIIPHLTEGNDNFSRLSDYTIDVRSIKNGELGKISEYIHEQQLQMTYSSVHVHLYDGDFSKGTTLKRWLRERGIHSDAVLTVGDSANDESILNTAAFPYSCWVGGEATARDLGISPGYVTSEREGLGFEEIVNVLSSARQ